MRLLRFIALLSVFFFVLTAELQAQDVTGNTGPWLKGRHELSLHVGALNWSSVEAEVSPGSIETDTRVNGFLGSVNYAYWLENDVAITLSGGGTGLGVSADISAGSVRSETDAVGFILVGASYYPAAVAFRPNVLGFVAAAVGSYVGEATNTRVEPGSVRAENIRETAFGVRLAAGVDWFITRRLVTGFNLGYHVMSDFDQSVGGSENYSGPEMSVSLGVIIGRGRRPAD